MSLRRVRSQDSPEFFDSVDEERLLSFARQHLSAADDCTILVVGGTGFVGRWALRALAALGAHTGRSFKVIVLVRDLVRAQLLLSQRYQTILIEFEQMGNLDSVGEVDQIWHFSAHTGSPDTVREIEIIDADVGVTLSLLKFASLQRRTPTFLYTSSGAVYGRGRRDSVPVSEQHDLSTSNVVDTYDCAKRVSEILLQNASHSGIVNARVARLFAFVGPLLPLTAHFAIGNFIADGAIGRTVRVSSGGVDHRSWMYAGDLANVLLGMAFGDSPMMMNVGSDQSMSLAAAAERVAQLAGVDFIIEGDRTLDPTYYVPDVGLLRSTFGGNIALGFDEAVTRTIEWARSNPKALDEG